MINYYFGGTESPTQKKKKQKDMFDMDEFEREYREFILELKRKKYGDDYVEEPEPEPVKEEDKPKRNDTTEDKYNKIMQLRRDIQSGKVVMVSNGSGKFVWKKIKK